MEKEQGRGYPWEPLPIQALQIEDEGILHLGLGERTEWLVSWRVGTTGGISWVFADDLDAMWWSSVLSPSSNEYAGDVFINMLLHSVGAFPDARHL